MLANSEISASAFDGLLHFVQFGFLHALGYMYAKGLRIAKDVPEAVRLFEAVGKPLESTDAFAARMELGRIYSSGADVPVDVSKALYWYTAAIALSKDGDDSDDVVEAKAYVARETNAEANQP